MSSITSYGWFLTLETVNGLDCITTDPFTSLHVFITQNETANMTGLPGQKGEQGDQGIKGKTGNPGLNGTKGQAMDQFYTTSVYKNCKLKISNCLLTKKKIEIFGVRFNQCLNRISVIHYLLVFNAPLMTLSFWFFLFNYFKFFYPERWTRHSRSTREGIRFTSCKIVDVNFLFN